MSHSNSVNKILGMTTRPSDEAAEYRAFVDSGGRPQMGFSVTHASGDMEGFLYHLLDNMQLQTRSGVDFLSFTHRARAVTMQGSGLRVIMKALVRHTLMEIHVENGKPAAEAGLPRVTRLDVTALGQGEPVTRLPG